MANPRAFAEDYLSRLRSTLQEMPFDALSEVIGAIERAWVEGRQIFIAGNGGSAALASHMMVDLAKGTLGPSGRTRSRRVRVMALTDNVPLMTAWANDADYSRIFCEPLRNLGSPGDLLVAISASGNSANILLAARTARELGMHVVALTGFGGGELTTLADASFVVPAKEYGLVEDVHLILNHIVSGYLRELLASQPYQ
jgi:D-sedoheptulose 7-phosphate isomerase